MNRLFILLTAACLFVASACTPSVVTKKFTVTTDPPDAEIRVVSGLDLQEMKYHSPAAVVAETPKDPALTAKTFVQVRREDYLPKTLSLADVRDGDRLTIRLEKIMPKAAEYKLSFKLIGPVVSPELRYRDKTMALSLTVAEKSFQMKIENISNKNAKILWEQAEYTDVNRQRHRLIHSGIRFQERNNPVPNQSVQPRSAVLEAVIPVSNIYVKRPGEYDVRPLFDLTGDTAEGLKGKTISLFIPVEMDRQIIPYQFTIQITKAEQDQPK